MLINSKYITHFVFNQLDNNTWITVNTLLELISIRVAVVFMFQRTIFVLSDAHMFIDCYAA